MSVGSFLGGVFGRNESAQALPEFPFPLEALNGSDAPERLAQLRVAGASENYWPILLGDRQELEASRELATGFGEPTPAAVQAILDEASQIDVAAWFESRAAEYEDSDVLDFATDEPLAKPLDALGLTTHTDTLSKKPKKQVFICRLPTREAAAAFAHLRTGGWNSCPAPAEHVAIARYWHERFGAEVVAQTNDVVEFVVARPPRTDADALALAREQYLYCSDIVDQGVESIPALAAMLKDSSHWWFWWD